MSSIKCPNCGLVNFASATECKRCKQNLEDHAYPYWREKDAIAPPKPDWSKLQTVPAVPIENENLANYEFGSHPFGSRLFRIFLILTIILTPFAVSYMNSSLPREIWKLLIDPKSKYYLATFEPLYYVVLSGAVVFTLSALILLITLSLKSKVFLKLVRIHLLAEMLCFALEAWLIFKLEVELREKQISQLAAAANDIQTLPYLAIVFILIAVLWYAYFATSKRARSVFE
jgi:hypothetical protein